MIHTRQTVECDRCHKMTDLAELVHERVKQERPGHSGALTDFEQLQQSEGEKFAMKVEMDLVGVKVKFDHLCESCRQRVKNLALEIASRYGEVTPSNPRKKKTAGAEQPGDVRKDGELPLGSPPAAA